MGGGTATPSDRPNFTTIGNDTFFSQRKSMFLKIVNTGELPTSECNQYAKGILTVDMQTKTEQKILETSQVVLKHRKL